mgnify:CR=1 FL=1
MKYYVISGETSGDQHAAKVINQLKQLDSNAHFRGMGGDQSRAAGLELLLHQKSMAIMGFWEVLKSIFKILKVLKLVKRDLANWQPDVILLIDYPGFNLKIVKYASSKSIPVHYYISPKVWAWKENRVKSIKRYVDELYSILPFEIEYYKSKGLDIKYVGNPSKEAVDDYLKTIIKTPNQAKLALLPGSRKQEIISSLPIMLKAARKAGFSKFVIAQAPNLDANLYTQFGENLELVQGKMYDVLASAEAAIVTSGTATLETALMNVPQVVCYRTSAISYAIGKMVVKLKYISLVNLILDNACILELIQDDFTEQNITAELKKIKQDKYRKEMQLKYKRMRNQLGNSRPSAVVAHSIYNAITKT